jgi:hypothetical protein
MHFDLWVSCCGKWGAHRAFLFSVESQSFHGCKLQGVQGIPQEGATPIEIEIAIEIDSEFPRFENKIALKCGAAVLDKAQEEAIASADDV